MKYANTVSKSFLFYVAGSSLISALSIVRLMGFFDTAQLNQYLLVITICPFVFLIFYMLNRRIHFDGVSATLTGMMFFGVTVGILRGNELINITSDTIVLLVALSSYLIGIQPNAATVINRLKLHAVAHIILYGQATLLISGLVALYLLNLPVYHSFSDILITLSLAWFLELRKRTPALIIMTMVLASGKLGVFFAAIAVCGISYCIKHEIRGRFIVSFALFCAVSLNALLFYNSDLMTTSWFSSSALMTKLFSTYNPYTIEYFSTDISSMVNTNAESIGGGRVSELLYAILLVGDLNNAPYLIGVGHGFTFDMWYSGEFREGLRNLHFSPATIAIKYGILGCLIFFCSIVFALRTAFIRIKTSNNALPTNNLIRVSLSAMFAYCIGALVFSATAYYIFVALPFWLFLGLLNNPNLLKIRQTKQILPSNL